MPSFIETQFPIARLSAEAYKERKANNGQTLTRLGKWWGRKPLILVRASIIGMLMPASNDPKKDREIFLKILTMDDDGTLGRWRHDKKFSVSELGALSTKLERDAWNELDGAMEEAKETVKDLRNSAKLIPRDQKAEKAEARGEIATTVGLAEERAEALNTFISKLQITVFSRLPYAERIRRCERPENISGPSSAAWHDINAHLNSEASNIQELVEQLGQREFGHTPRVGDSFCGGGSIPFEAARIGCEAFGSDLNPVACLLTWASLNLLGGGKKVQEEVIQVQSRALAQADKQITEWGIEHNEQGERADAYLYCVEVKPDGCDYYIPLAPSWLIGEKSKVVADWKRVEGCDTLQPNIRTISSDELKQYKAKKGATIAESRVLDPFDPDRSWSMASLRGTEGLRLWTKEDIMPRKEDVFQERLYCIRWVKTVIDSRGKVKEVRRYAAPTKADLQREDIVQELLNQRLDHWQNEGLIPSMAIVSGYNTNQPIRERGWTYWHHLFTPRQLLSHGLIAENTLATTSNQYIKAASLLGMGRMADWNARLSAWMSHKGNEKGNQVFYNQALNCHSNYSTRAFSKLPETFRVISGNAIEGIQANSTVLSSDARDLTNNCDLWITDPPYADAVNYHELGDFFLAWYDKQLAKAFPEWTPDARSELAVKGDGDDFRRSMVDIYKNLAKNMPDNGMQMVQFTHQNSAVWADLGMILWAAGLKATAAWTISTETEAAGLKKGNYVQGTVCLVLRKRVSPEPGFLDEVYPLVEDEVRRQVASMQSLDQDAEPNFNDADYRLAAYAAALKVLTQYASLDGQDVEHEVFAVRDRNEISAFQMVIERAIGIACDTLVPKGLEEHWSDLTLVERYYLSSLDIESRGERRKGMYEELARGFGVKDLRPLLKSDTANGTRMQTAKGMGKRNLDAPAVEGDDAVTGAHPFGCTPLRHLLFAIHETGQADNDPELGRQYLRDTFGPSYWAHREKLVYLLEWLTALGNTEDLREWQPDSEAARILTGRLRNDHD